MELHVDPVTVLIDELVGMASIAVHEAVAIWDTSIAHEDHNLMNGLGILR